MKLWPFSSSNPTASFWRWFNANRERLHKVDLDNQALMHEATARLRRVAPGLVCEFALTDGRATEVVISASGDISLFPVVERVVAAAPKIPGWEITAFRQPRTTKGSIKTQGVVVDASSLWFKAEPDGQKTGITVYFPTLTPENEEVMGTIAFLWLDHALGEFLMETSVGFIDVQGLPPSPETLGLHPFASILDHVPQLVQ